MPEPLRRDPLLAGADLFAHYSEIVGSGFKTLQENQAVEFVVKQGPKGPQASQIKPM
ncbi:MAG: cold-shock protein [Betaproteobacteria bacterium]